MPLVRVSDQAGNDVFLCLLECHASKVGRGVVLLDGRGDGGREGRAGDARGDDRRLAVARGFERDFDLARLFTGVPRGRL
jgi:hypothetical protein